MVTAIALGVMALGATRDDGGRPTTGVASASAVPRAGPSGEPDDGRTATARTPEPADRDTACRGVDVAPGDDIGDVLQARPEGTTFCILPGVHRLASTLTPRDDQRLVGRAGAVLDGGGTVEDGIGGFTGHHDRVTIEGLEIRNLTGDGIETGADWTVLDTVVHDTEIGIRAKIGARLIGNHVHHNTRYGIVVNGGGRTQVDRIVVRGNEIAFNNTARHDEGDEGGTKFLKARGLEVIGNHVHDNIGNGLWTDSDNTDVLYAHNVVEDNTGVGIFHEISYDAVIRGNTLRNNATDNERSILYGAQLLIQNSQRVDVDGNTVEGAAHGIGVVATDRGAGLYGPYLAADIDIHDNTVATNATSGAAGLDRVTSSNVTFRRNRYVVPDDAGHWVWGSTQPLTWEAWRATGQEVDGRRTVRDDG